MNKPNISVVNEEIEKKYDRRGRKTKKRMKVSGSSVKKLQQIIKSKSQ